MRHDLRDPLGAVLAQAAEHAPERGVRRGPAAGLVERSVVDETQKELEEAAAGVVIGPFHEGPQPFRPFVAEVRVGLEQGGDEIGSVAMVPPQVAHGGGGEPVVVRGEPALDHAAPVRESEPGGRLEEPSPREGRQRVRVRGIGFDGLQRGCDPSLPDRPLLLGRIPDVGEEREGEILEMGPDALAREQSAQLPHVQRRVRIPEVRQRLSDSGTAEQMLLRALQ